MTPSMQVYNLTRGKPLALQAAHARTLWTRLKGLLGTSGLPQGGGLVIEPCNSVHMIGMSYPLDVVFASPEGVVLGLVEDLRPWKMTGIYRGARFAIELPVGAIAAAETRLGDQLEMRSAG